MPFVPGRKAETSICLSCYLTVAPTQGQTLLEAEIEHVCGLSDHDKTGILMPWLPPYEV